MPTNPFAPPFIPAADLATKTPGSGDHVVGVDAATGNPRRFPVTDMPASTVVAAQIATLQAGQTAGMLGFQTKAMMDAALSYNAGTLALVTNDPTPANNGTYRKSGASGSGSWTQSADRVTGLEQNTLDWTHPSKSATALTFTGSFIHKDTGAATSSAGFDRTDFIRVMPSTPYTINATTAGNATHAWYDANQTFISAFGISQSGAINVTSPANAAYARLTQQTSGGPYPFAFRTTNADIDIDRLRSVFTAHAPPIPKLDTLAVDSFNWTHPSVPESALSVSGSFVQISNGAIEASGVFKCSGFIRVLPSTSYLCAASTAGSAGHAWYDENQTFISSFGASQTGQITVTSPSNAAYVRLTQQVSGGPFPWQFQTANADVDVDRLRTVLSKHMPNVPASAVIDNGELLPLILDRIESNQAAMDATQKRLNSALKTSAIEGSYRGIFGNRIVAIGDSTMRGTYNGDSAAGVDGSTLDVAGDSWFSHMCFASGQQITRVANVGDIGATVQELSANFASTVIARHPDTVIISGGTNNAVLPTPTTPADYRSVVEGMITAALNAKIVPVLASVLPSANDPKYSNNVLYNNELQSLATQYGLYYIDLYTFALDSGTGGLKAEYSGDGVHPSAAGQKAMGLYAATLLDGRVLGSAPALAMADVESDNLAVNPLFNGTPGANGNAPSWLISGSLPAGATASVVTKAGVAGKVQRISASSTASDAIILQYLPTDKWDPGDLLEITGYFSAIGTANKRVFVDFTGAAGQWCALSTTQACEGVFHLRVPLAAGVTIVGVNLSVDAGTGTLDVGQVKVRNLTALGIA